MQLTEYGQYVGALTLFSVEVVSVERGLKASK